MTTMTTPCLAEAGADVSEVASAAGSDLGALAKDPAAGKRIVRQLMDTTVRIHITDGRIITGQLWCFDQLQNAILLNCQETRVAKDSSRQHRPLGPLVMVPGKHLVKIEALKAKVEDAAVRAAALDCAGEDEGPDGGPA